MSGPRAVAPGEEGPVTVSISRRVRPGRERDYETWLRGITRAASRFAGHQGVSVLRPSGATGGRWVLIYRFDSWAHCAAWEDLQTRADHIAQLGDMVEGAAQTRRVTGLEAWFDLPEVPAARPAPRWKMALVLIVVVFALVYPLQRLLGPVLAQAGWPAPLITLGVVTLQVVVMTWVVMPPVTRLLRGWLFR